jgi:hypothetical protein
MANGPPAFVDPLMRFGYAARVVYLLVGALAFVASVDGGCTPDSKSALGTLLQMSFGKVLLAIIALGLPAYALWCFINAGFDLDDKGNVRRAGRCGRWSELLHPSACRMCTRDAAYLSYNPGFEARPGCCASS